MAVQTRTIELDTQGNADVIDITQQIVQLLGETALQNGVVTLFSPSATSVITTIEYEAGAVNDFRRLFDEIANPDRPYAHNARWGDGNGHSHVRAALVGPSLSVPFVDGELTLGMWQQIIFVDFDNRTRHRKVIVQIMGEPG